MGESMTLDAVTGNGCQGSTGHDGGKGEAGCPVEVLHDVVAIVVQKGRTSSGGIALPDNLKDKTLTGKVVAVGPGRYPDDYIPDGADGAARFPMSIRVGDTVVFPNLVGLDVVVGGVTYHMVHEGDILARIPGQ